MQTSPPIAQDSPLTTRHADPLAAAFLIIVTLLFGCRGITEGGLGWSDGPQHMMNGAFVLAAVREHPLGHLREWAEQFYLRHPALGIVVYWPPGFGAVEALFFAVAGVSISVARFSVVAFAAGAVVLVYLLATRWFDRRTGLLAALLMLACPHGRLWLTDVMVEWPATFWLLLTVWLYVRWRDTGRARSIAAAAAAYVMAVMTKQTAGFIGPVLLIHALLDPTARARLRRPAAIISALAAAGVLAVYFLLTRSITPHYADLTRLDGSDPLYYLLRLDETASWPIAMLAAVGLIAMLRARASPDGGLLLLWFAAWLAFSSLIAARQPRFFFYCLPPMAIWAASCCGIYLRRFSLGAVVVGLVAGLSTWSAWRQPPVRLPRYDAAVRALVARGDADAVLVDGVREGQFVVDAYLDPQARDRIIPLRASKLLFARAARERYRYQQFVHSTDDIAALLDEYGICYIVMESALPRTDYVEADPPPRKLLRELVADASRFEPLASWPLRCNDPAWDHVELRLYRYRACRPRQSDKITLPIPGMGRSVTVPLPPR
jgi:hypothetical protein